MPLLFSALVSSFGVEVASGVGRSQMTILAIWLCALAICGRECLETFGDIGCIAFSFFTFCSK